MSVEYTLVQLLIDSDIVIQNNKSNTDSDTRNLVDSLQYHSRRLAYKLHAARYSKPHLVPKHKRKGHSNPHIEHLPISKKVQIIQITTCQCHGHIIVIS